MQNETFMRLALKEAAKGAGHTAPNPLVGAVIVKDGQVIGKGYHRKFGGPHAEVNALCDAGHTEYAGSNNGDLSGATLYVTLEPCCHHGKTPPCTEAIIRSGIRTVIIGATDTNPLVAGKGIRQLKNHGITVETGILEAECRKQNEIYFHGLQYHTPFVLMKYAMTADGKIAARTGASKWITGEEARSHTHQTRSRYTAIMVGIGTILADNPTLTSHDTGRDPNVIICDSHLRTPLDSTVIKSAGNRDIYIATRSQDSAKIEALRALGVTVLHPGKLRSNPPSAQVNLPDLMHQLYSRGVDSILLEGGGTLNYSALSSGIVNRLHLYIGAKLFGGAEALSPIEGVGVSEVADACPLILEEIQTLGNDIFADYKTGGPPCSPE